MKFLSLLWWCLKHTWEEREIWAYIKEHFGYFWDDVKEAARAFWYALVACFWPLSVAVYVAFNRAEVEARRERCEKRQAQRK